MPRNGLKPRDFLKTLRALAAVPAMARARIKITDVRIVPLRTVKDLWSYPDRIGGVPPYRCVRATKSTVAIVFSQASFNWPCMSPALVRVIL